MVPYLLTHTLLGIPQDIRNHLNCYAKVRHADTDMVVWFPAVEFLKCITDLRESELHAHVIDDEKEIFIKRSALLAKDTEITIKDCGILRWMLFSTFEREIHVPEVFDSLEAAQEKMRDDFAETVDYSSDAIFEFIEDHPDECELNDMDAWINDAATGNGNSDWQIMPFFQSSIYALNFDFVDAD